MTVADLITKLQKKMPQDARVVLRDDEAADYYDAEGGRLIDKGPDGCEHCNAELPVVVIE